MRSYCNSGTHAHVHEISNQDDGAVFYDSVSVCFLRACNAASRERAERRSFSSGRNCVNDCKLFGRNIHGYAFWNPTTEQCLLERALVDDPLPLSNETHSHGDVSRFHCTVRYALEDRYIAVHNRWRRQNEIPIWRKHRVPKYSISCFSNLHFSGFK